MSLSASEGSDRRRGGSEDDHWVDRWPIAHRMLLTVGLPVLAILAGATFVTFQADAIHDAYHDELQERQERASLLELEASFEDVVESAHTYVITQDTQNRSRLESQITTFEDRMAEREDPLEQADRRAMFSSFEENATAYVEIVRRVQGRIEEGNQEGAQQLLTSPRTDRKRTNALASLDELQAAEQRDIDRQQAEFAQAMQTLTRGVLLATVAALMVTIVIGFDVANRTQTTMDRLSAKLDNRLDRLETKRGDQRDRLREQLAVLDAAHERVAEISAATDGIDDRLHRSQHYAEAIEQAAREGTKRLEISRAGLDETEEGLATLAEDVLDVSEEVDQLEDAADELASLADQIDMLALNASVEASRTGIEAQGLGEVRDLAERSLTRTQRLADAAETAQTETESAAMALERSDKALTDTRERTREASQAFDQVEDFLEDTRAETERLRTLTDEQRRSIDEITTHIEEARGDAEMAADSTDATDQLLEDLEDVSRRLEEVS